MKKATLETAVGIFVLIGLACVGYLTIKLGRMELLGENYYPLKARFFSVAGLKEGSRIELAGVQIGRVESIELDMKRYVAEVGLKIEKEVKITEDSIASVKTAGLIGDRYIQISPGGSEVYLKPGETILETESPVDLQELISKYVFGGVEKK